MCDEITKCIRNFIRIIYNWLGSYLEHTTQFVCIDNVKLKLKNILWNTNRINSRAKTISKLH